MVIGVAGRQVPAVPQLAGQFDLEAFGGGTLDGAVHRLGINAADILGDVVLFDAVQGEPGVQAPVEVFSLDARFKTFALYRIEQSPVGVLAHLRLIDAGVAGVHRPGVVEIIDKPGIRRDDTALAIAVAQVGGVRVAVIQVVVPREVADTRAEDQRQVVDGLEPGGQVGTGLALDNVVGAHPWDPGFRKLAAPVEDAAVHWRVHRTVYRYVLARAH
ncbi:hypothetical protein D9M69_553870 [compost metagenome]